MEKLIQYGPFLEEWKNIKGYQPFYKISNYGRVYSLYSWKIIKDQPHSKGYRTISLSIDGKDKDHYIHRLVAEAFIDNDDFNKNEVNHKIPIKNYNHVSNLEWCTRIENMRHASNLGLRKEGCNTNQKKGSLSPFAKEIEKIRKSDNVVLKIYGCISSVIEDGYNVGNVSSCLKEKRKTANGFIWKYKKHI